MSLINLRRAEFSVGGPPLLDGVDLAVERGERIAIIGRNGEGKSTLLRLIEGLIVPEDGEVVIADGVRIASLPQEVPSELAGSVFEVVASGLGETGRMLAEYHRGIDEGADLESESFAALTDGIEQAGGWNADQKVEETLTRLGLPTSVEFRTLSGGMRRRVLLGKALVSDPDVLLLDEPTNHLDIETIEWLEGVLKQFGGAILFVTHDRRFLRALATRIVEIDRGSLTSWPGDYENYLRRREERLHAESLEDARFDKRLAEEEVWIRQGIKARRTRNEGRVRALEAMRRERAARRERLGQVELTVSEAARGGRKVVVAEDVSVAFDDHLVFEGLTTTILRGDRVGLIGPNGSGKTTLIRTLLGQLEPTSGSVVPGTGIELAYFDQYRESLREDWNAVENVAEGREFVTVGGRQRHAIGYLQEFLFTPERARAPITRLSGGERNRLLLARLFARPSNVLVMDEPTNDLDVETLELLEEQLAAYSGTLILVSHDRDFLDAVVTSTLVIEPDGQIHEFVGGYADWERQRAQPSEVEPVASAPKKPPEPSTQGKRKLSYKLQRELEVLPQEIERLEIEIEAISKTMSDPDFFRRPQEKIVAIQEQLASKNSELETCFERWEALEAMRSGE